jgi:hypothetical protein
MGAAEAEVVGLDFAAQPLFEARDDPWQEAFRSPGAAGDRRAQERDSVRGLGGKREGSEKEDCGAAHDPL